MHYPPRSPPHATRSIRTQRNNRLTSVSPHCSSPMSALGCTQPCCSQRCGRQARAVCSASATRRPQNVPGPLFVDSTCIDCDACRALAPATFVRLEGQSAVAAQPAEDASARLLALQAVLVCPTASIHFPVSRRELAAAEATFPLPVTPHVAYLGFHSRLSFGAASYLIARGSGGNVMVESPRFSERLADRIAALGGVRWIWLSHRDDVGDAPLWAARFGAQRVVYASEDVEAERQLDGSGPWTLDGQPDCTVLYTPGHTRGSCSLLHSGEGGSLFSGDSLAAAEGTTDQLSVFRDFCWYSLAVQMESLATLIGQPFTRVLPGHGRRASFTSPEAKDAALRTLLSQT